MISIVSSYNRKLIVRLSSQVQERPKTKILKSDQISAKS